jgi:hypothetical protein
VIERELNQFLEHGVLDFLVFAVEGAVGVEVTTLLARSALLAR